MRAKIKHLELKLLLTFLIFSFWFIQWYGWNEESNFVLVRAIVEEKRFEINSFANQTGDRSFLNSNFYSDKDPGLAFLASPIYFIWKSLYTFFPKGFKERYAGSNDHVTELYDDTPIITLVDKGFFLFTSMILLTFLTSGIFTALTALLIFKISRYLTKDLKERILLSLAYFFGTIAFHYSLHFMNHAISTFLSFFSFFLLFKAEKEKKERYRNFILSGILFGFSIVVDKFLLVFLPFFILYSLSINRKCFLLFLLFLLISYVPYSLYTYSILKKPFGFLSSYVDKRIFRRAYSNPQPVESSADRMLEASILDLKTLVKMFHLEGLQPNSVIMLRLLFYPYRGLFFYSPILILSLFGLYFMLDEYEGETFMIFFMLLAMSAVISMRRVWWGGYCFGPRYLLPIVPFLILPLHYSFKKFGEKCFLIFLLISFSINLLGLQPAEEVAYDWNSMDISREWQAKENTLQIIYNPLVKHYLPLTLKHGPRSGIFEHLINGYISIDIRFPPLSKGVDFPFSRFHIPFLVMLPIFFLQLLVWRNEVKMIIYGRKKGK